MNSILNKKERVFDMLKKIAILPCILLIVSSVIAQSSSYVTLVEGKNIRGLTAPNETFYPESLVFALRNDSLIKVTGESDWELFTTFPSNYDQLEYLRSYGEQFLFSRGMDSFSGRGLYSIDQNGTIQELHVGDFDAPKGIRIAPDGFGTYGSDIFMGESGNYDIISSGEGIVRINDSYEKSLFYDGVNSSLTIREILDLIFIPNNENGGTVLYALDYNQHYSNLNNHRILSVYSDQTAEVFFDLNDLGNDSLYNSLAYSSDLQQLFLASNTNIYQINFDGTHEIVGEGFNAIHDIEFSNSTLFIADTLGLHAFDMTSQISDSGFVDIFHNTIPETTLNILFDSEGISGFLSDFSQHYIYKFELNGGGGIASENELLVSLEQVPQAVIGNGESDAQDDLVRTGVGLSRTNYTDLNGQGWIDLTSTINSDSFFVKLNSKWGTDYDSYLTLWLGFSSPLSDSLLYEIVSYPNGFDQFTITAYQIFRNDTPVTISEPTNTLSEQLLADGLSDYQSTLESGYSYKMHLTGGGGSLTDAILKLYIDHPATLALARGTSDADDEEIRCGIGAERNNLVNVQGTNWIDVTSELQSNYSDYRLNSKWATDHDTEIEMWVSFEDSLDNAAYVPAEIPAGFQSISIARYNAISGSTDTLGLIAHYPFDGDANDISGNDYHGSVNGPVLTSDRFGSSNSAYQFDGIDDYIELPIINLDNQSFTISAWVMVQDTSLNNTIYSNGEGTSGYDDGIRRFAIRQGGNLRFDVAIADNPRAESLQRLTENNWYFVTLVCDNSSNQGRLYINAQLDTTWDISSMWGHLNTNVTHAIGVFNPLGGTDPNKKGWFDGKIDDVRFYGRTLSTNEIGALYTPATSNIDLSGTIYYTKNNDIFKMDLTTGTESPILATPSSESNPVLSPDQTHIAYASDANSSRYQLWIMEEDGTNTQEISSSLDHVRPADWEGENIFLNAYEPYGSGGSIWLYDGSNFSQLFYESGKDAYVKDSWLNEEWLVGTKTTRYGGDGGALLKISTDGTQSEQTLWTDNAAVSVNNPSVSNNRNKVVYQYQPTSSDPSNIYIYDMTLGEVNLLIQNANDPTWAPDDEYVMFNRYSDLWITDLSGNAERVTSDGVLRRVTTWTGDSRTTANIAVSIDSVEAQLNDTIAVAVRTQFPADSSYLSAELYVGGYQAGLEFIGIDTVETLAGQFGWDLTINEVNDQLISWMAGSEPIDTSGVLTRLQFAVTGSLCTTIPINIDSALFDTATDSVITNNGGVRIQPVPDYGDVDENGQIQAFDAAKILMHTVGIDTLACQALANAEVSQDGGISSLDASILLMYGVALLDTLPYDSSEIDLNAAGTVNLVDQIAGQNGTFSIPVTLAGGQNIRSFEMEFEFNAEQLTFDDFIATGQVPGFSIQSKAVGNQIKMAGARTRADGNRGLIGYLRLHLDETSEIEQSTVHLTKLRFNEENIQNDVASTALTTTTGVQHSHLPRTYALQQNHPNPFNPVTTIEYQLPEDGFVTLEVYDIRGTFVTALVNTHQQAGYYSLKWLPKEVSSGVYFYRIESGDFVDVKKMVFMK